MIEVSMMTMNWAAAMTAEPSQRRLADGGEVLIDCFLLDTPPGHRLHVVERVTK